MPAYITGEPTQFNLKLKSFIFWLVARVEHFECYTMALVLQLVSPRERQKSLVSDVFVRATTTDLQNIKLGRKLLPDKGVTCKS